ncbi:hypothetical protein CH275_16725 [Rhodococcus sp. 06-235-1A]|nr:hypothetical protein CH275_16725 [Rhodococcus sp. 06-235-1A]
MDSNILIDLQQHGSALFDDNEDLGAHDPEYRAELFALSYLVNIWLMRDIRFIVTPRSYTDAKRPTHRFLSGRVPTIEALADSLAFQYEDWNLAAPSETEVRIDADREIGLGDSADRDLVLEAESVGAHVFLTRDVRLRKNVRTDTSELRVLSPTGLETGLMDGHVSLPWGGGLCSQNRCPYLSVDVPGPDMGKWSAFLGIFE